MRFKKEDLDSFGLSLINYKEGDLGFEESVINKLIEKESILIKEKEYRNEIITKCGSHIMTLWDILQIPTEDRDTFFDMLGESSLSLKAIELCKTAIATLENQKLKRLEELIVDSRKEIILLWENRHLGDDDKKKFKCFYTDEISAEILRDLQNVASDLKRDIEESKDILELIKKRNNIYTKKERIRRTNFRFKKVA